MRASELRWVTLTAVLGAALAAAPGLARAGEYEEALAAAAAAGRAGDHARAAALLAGPAERWPQDLPLRLARADHLLLAGDAPGAAAEYEAARELVPTAPEPLTGLGWAALRARDVALARARFAAALAVAPGNPGARAGLDALGPEHRAWLGLTAAGTSYAGIPARTWLASGALSLDGVVADHWVGGALWRPWVARTTTSSSRGSGRGAGGSGTQLDFAQHELHLAAGRDAGAWALRLHGAWASDPASETVAHGGWAAAVSGNWRGPVELSASAALSRYSDLDVGQGEARAAMPIAGPLWLSLGGRGQVAGGGTFGAALASLDLRGRWEAGVSGEVGNQRRPYDLDARALYATEDDLRWAVRARAGAPLGDHLRLLAGWDLEAVRAPRGAGTVDGTLNRGWLGLSLAL